MRTTDPKTLIDVLQGASHLTSRGYTFLRDDLSGRAWSFQEIERETDRRAALLLSKGLRKGDRVAMVVPDGEDFVLSFFGAVRAGLVPVPMYPPLALGKLDSYIDTAARILRASEAKLLIASKQVAQLLWSLVPKIDTLQDLMPVEKLRGAAPAPAEGRALLQDIELSGDDPCFLQFTSGSTADPKGVVVTHKNLVANSRAIMFDGLSSSGEHDVGVSWLPLYHDMGLIGFVIAPMMATVPVVFIPTLTFVKRPSTWMETISKYRGTITFAPNFAFGLAAKRARKLESLDLSCLRVLGCGAEPINPVTMRNFVQTFQKAGFNENALMPCYGMAEATLAISFDDLSRPFKTQIIQRTAYEEQGQVLPYDGEDEHEALEIVSCGKTFPHHEVGIVSEQGDLLGEGKVGEIVLKGPSVARGYFKNEDATRAVLKDGWLYTGDLGFLLEGEVYISGRKKDMIILNGRNYYPQAIEWLAEQVDGIRKGNAVAFSTPGREAEELVLVAETKSEQPVELSATVARHIKSSLGVRVQEVLLVGPGALPKTSSGKLQRRKTRSMYESGALGGDGNRTMGSTATSVTLARHITKSAVAKIGHRIKSSLRRAEQR